MLAELDVAELQDAAGALGYLRETEDGIEVLEGADTELDRLRTQLVALRNKEGSALDIIESIRAAGTRDIEEFQSAVIDYIANETDIDHGTIRTAAIEDAVHTADFVSGTLRNLGAELEADVESREKAVASQLQSAVGTAESDVTTAV